jgi:phosphatidylinositol glycan class F
MASTTTLDPSATAPPRAPPVPIEPLNTDAARIYTHIHPILVLSLYAYKFRDLVADPVPALFSTLLPLAVLQIAFVAICLPPTSGTGGAPQVKKQKAGEKKKVAPSKVERGINGTVVVC